MVYAIKERGGGAGGKSTCPLPLFKKLTRKGEKEEQVPLPNQSV